MEGLLNAQALARLEPPRRCATASRAACTGIIVRTAASIRVR